MGGVSEMEQYGDMEVDNEICGFSEMGWVSKMKWFILFGIDYELLS